MWLLERRLREGPFKAVAFELKLEYRREISPGHPGGAQETNSKAKGSRKEEVSSRPHEKAGEQGSECEQRLLEKGRASS